jgi:hypothetical protein
VAVNRLLVAGSDIPGIALDHSEQIIPSGIKIYCIVAPVILAVIRRAAAVIDRNSPRGPAPRTPLAM